MHSRAVPTAVLAVLAAGTCLSARIDPQAATLVPGTRVLLDAHNAYPYDGRFGDRVARALATGVPVAIEQDLIWRAGANGPGVSVVGHDVDKVADAPTFESYFFGTIAPVMDRAVKENRRDRWPLVVLNLDFKTNEPAHHAHVRQVLGRHRQWLTSAPRTSTPAEPAAMTVGPLLVLTGSNESQQVDFHDTVAVGDALWLFGAYEAPTPAGDTPEARAMALATAPVETLLPHRATNYRRWANFPWHVIEKGGQPHAGAWDAADRTRLDALVTRAHDLGLWVRFYTLNGHASADAERQGWSKGYNFGSLADVSLRWAAAREAKVDFVATDQYEAYHLAVNSGR
jgi:hypothetical protein